MSSVKDILESLPQQDRPEDDVLLDVVQDILDNGGDIPQVVPNRLLMGAIRKTYRATMRNVNVSSRNQNHLWALTALFIMAIAGALLIRHYDLVAIQHALPGVDFIFIVP